MLNQNYINWRVFFSTFLFFSLVFFFFRQFSVYTYIYIYWERYWSSHSSFNLAFSLFLSLSLNSLCVFRSRWRRAWPASSNRLRFSGYTRTSWKPLIIIVVQLAVVPRMEDQWEGWFFTRNQRFSGFQHSLFLSFLFLSFPLFLSFLFLSLFF